MDLTSLAPDDASRIIKQLDEYKAKVTRLFPTLPRHAVDQSSIKDGDAITLARFLALYLHEVMVVEIGTFVGVSTFHLARQPKVSEVVSIDRNPSLAEAVGKRWEGHFSADVRLQDVAEATLAHFPEQRRKVRLVTGTLGSLGKEVFANEAPIVAFLDGDHSKEGVEADLKAIFENSPHAVAILHDCVNSKHGPAVLAGIETFVEAAPTGDHSGYRFRLFKQLDTGRYAPNLGILYPEAAADQVERLAADLLEDPISSLFRVSYLRRQAFLQQREEIARESEKAENYRKEAERQSERAENYRKEAERQRKREKRQRKAAKRQRTRANRMKARLSVLAARPPWWRRIFLPPN